MPLLILLAAVFLGTGNCSSKIVHGNVFLQKLPWCSRSLSKICNNVIKFIFREEVFMVRNTVKTGQSWCSTIICIKKSAFEMQFHLIVISILFKNVCERSLNCLFKKNGSGRLKTLPRFQAIIKIITESCLHCIDSCQ